MVTTAKSYQAKKLLKLPKEMPSNIVSPEPNETKLIWTVWQIIKSDAVEPAQPMLQAEQLAHGMAKTMADPKVKIDFKRLQ